MNLTFLKRNLICNSIRYYVPHTCDINKTKHGNKIKIDLLTWTNIGEIKSKKRRGKLIP